ncbi:hypothetical protein [Haloplanus litoreus]|uniref:Uncharacterized protein n=1 Tax=Haloplanus litoreus TaxID=767515 RepID=A0ABD6A3H0_9EURY
MTIIGLVFPKRSRILSGETCATEVLELAIHRIDGFPLDAMVR